MSLTLLYCVMYFMKAVSLCLASSPSKFQKMVVRGEQPGNVEGEKVESSLLHVVPLKDFVKGSMVILYFSLLEHSRVSLIWH